MEAYPPPYVEHNLPLILLSGLGDRRDKAHVHSEALQQESGTRVVASSPECGGERAQQLLNQFLDLDGSDLAWNSAALPGPTGSLKYRMKTSGRVGGTATAKTPYIYS